MAGEDERREAARRRRRGLIERLNRNEERLEELEVRRREPGGRLSEEELAREIEMERERNLARRGYGLGGF
jgi:hypothetical protein